MATLKAKQSAEMAQEISAAAPGSDKLAKAAIDAGAISAKAQATLEAFGVLHERAIYEALGGPQACPFIVCMQGYDEVARSLYLEICPGLDIMEWLKGEPQGTPRRPSEIMIRTITLSALMALKHMHGRGIVHFDVKPDNMFATDSFEALTERIIEGSAETISLLPGAFKLGDVGLAKLIPPVGFLVGGDGTVIYMSPEASLLNASARALMAARSAPEGADPPNYECLQRPEMADLWSVGVMLYFLVVRCVHGTDETPFHCTEDEIEEVESDEEYNDAWKLAVQAKILAAGGIDADTGEPVNPKPLIFPYTHQCAKLLPHPSRL